MNQNIWGPPTWVLIHSIALTYPINPTQEQKLQYKHFFINLKEILPCNNCRKNYEIHLRMHPIRLDTRLSLFQWTVDIHNEVNKKNNKKLLSYNEAHAIFENLYGKHISYKIDNSADNSHTNTTPFVLHNNIMDFNLNNKNSQVKSMDDKYFIMLVLLLLIIIVILLFRNRKCTKIR